LGAGCAGFFEVAAREAAHDQLDGMASVNGGGSEYL
jgi:hypothetical protein